MAGSILFDVDGVLLDSMAVYEAAWAAWSARFGVPLQTIRGVAPGRRPIDIVRSAFRGDPAAWPAALAHFEEVLASLWRRDVAAMPGALDVLAGLSPRSWALVSSAPRHVVEVAFGRLGIEVPSASVFGEDVVVGKPDPSCYLLAARHLGVRPEHLLVVEDAPAGIAAARAAGMRVLAIASTHEPDDLREADEVFASLPAAAERIEAWAGV